MPFDVNTIRQQFPTFTQTAVQTTRTGDPLHYLDNASTTQIPQVVLETYIRYEMTSRANVQRGSYYLAEQATAAYQQARSIVSHYLNAQTSEEIIFTSGTTESVNSLAFSFGHLLSPGDEIVVSEAEHHSNFLPWQRLCQKNGIVLRVLPVLESGCLDIASLPEYVSERCRLIAITHCSNVTGAVTDITPIVSIANSVGAKVFLDGAQMVPHGRVDVQALGVDFYVFSGHKCFAPNGIGVLWGRKVLLDTLPPFQLGGGMVDYVAMETARFSQSPHRFEAGTPPIAQAVALGAALEWLMLLDQLALNAHEQRLFTQAVEGLKLIPGIRLLGSLSRENCQPVISFVIDNIHPHDLCHVLDEKGVALRGGHHCAQLLLRKMGVKAATRMSIAAYNNQADIDAFLRGVQEAVEVLS